MNILMVMHSHELGGIEAHTLALMKGLAGRGHRVVYAGPLDGWLGEEAGAAGLERVHIPMHGMFDSWSAWRLARAAQRYNVDLVHSHANRGARYAAWAARLAGIPAVGTAHSTNAGKHFSRVNRIIAVSTAVADSLYSCGYEAARVQTVHLGIADPYERAASVRTRMREQLGLAPGDIALGLIARFVKDKGHDAALKALAACADLPLRLFFAGDADASWGQAMRRRVKKQGMGNRVCFLGQRSDVPELLAAFDIVLAPSRREALSLTLLEASAMAKAIVASDVGGIPEVIEHNGTGLLIPVDNSDMLAQAIRRLAGDPALRERLGVEARRKFLERFRIEAMLERTEQIYGEVRSEARG